MDVRFKRGQDLDLSLRLSKLGYKILRKKNVIVNHHTISYTHYSRMWKTLFSGDIAYSNSFLFRKHIFNKYIYDKIFHNYYTLVSLFSFLIIAIATGIPFVVLFYLIIIFSKVFRIGKKSFFRNLELFAFYIVRDFAFLFYLFVPIKNIEVKDIKYTIVS